MGVRKAERPGRKPQRLAPLSSVSASLSLTHTLSLYLSCSYLIVPPQSPPSAACPGSPSCSGHGKCVSIKQLGQEANAEPIGPPRLYGGEPEAATWDEDKIQGCVCDSRWQVGYGPGQLQLPEYAGVDCSLQRCPSGDDPRTYDVDETDCEFFDDNGKTWKGIVGSDGRRYKSAAALPAGVTVATPASCTPGVDCGAAGNRCHVECGNRGLCDYKTGICACFKGYYGVACGTKSPMG